MQASEIVSLLNDLIQTTENGQKGFETAAEDVKDANLREIFLGYARECATSARELQDQVSAHGGKPATGGSTLGALHRGWVDVKSAVTNHDEAAILNECERGEDTAKSAYKKALEKDLPAGIRVLLQRQYEGTIRHHDRIRQLREKYRDLQHS